MLPSNPIAPRRVLHLEDDCADAELLAVEIRREWPNCLVTSVSRRDEFVEALRGETPDIVLSDFALGDFDGMAALELVREQSADIPFILVSGTIGEERAVAILKAGATDYVLKDRPARLVPAIRRALLDMARARSKRELEERFRQLAESSNDVFWFADLEPMRIQYISPAVRTIWELEPEDFYADPYAGLGRVHPEDRAGVKQNFHAWIAGTRMSFREEYRVVRPDGTIRWVLDEGAFTVGGDGRRRISGVARDITEAKESVDQSLRAQRLDSMGLLAGGIAHDLNNALAPIQMGLELLRGEIPEAHRGIFDQMLVSAKRGAGMVRQLLGFARGAEGRRIAVEPRRALREVGQLAATTFPKSIQVAVDADTEVPSIEIDPTLLHQVLLNLCVNARDAMPSGGTLTASVRAVTIDESYAGFVAGSRPGRYVVFSISDTGVGIPAEIRAKIFDPFFTTKAAGVGTGLGLTTVAGIAHNHGGFVRVYSEPGTGTCFKVYLPAAAKAAGEAPAQSASPIYRANGEVVLVADDEESVRVLLKSLLERCGFRVLVTRDGTEALAAFASRPREVKLVITDERMPHLDGLALVRALRHIAPDLAVIAMSGLHTEARMRDFTAAGIRQVLHKPFTVDELVGAVRAELDAPAYQPEIEFR